jgi:preprotein translocase subunit Sec61beta
MLFQSLKLRHAVVTNDFSNGALVTQSKNFRRMRNINNTEKNYRIASLRLTKRVTEMSKKKKESAPMPAASAGLLRFFEEETEGIKIRPELLVIFAVALIIISVLAQSFFPA